MRKLNLIQKRVTKIWTWMIIVCAGFGVFFALADIYDVVSINQSWVRINLIWSIVWFTVLFVMIFPESHKKISYRRFMMALYWVVAIGYVMFLYLGLGPDRYLSYIVIIPLALLGSEFYTVKDNLIGNFFMLLSTVIGRVLFEPASLKAIQWPNELLSVFLYLTIIIFVIANIDRMTQHRLRQEELFRKASAKSADLRRANSLLSEAFETLGNQNAEMGRLNQLLSNAFDELSQRNAAMEKDLSVASQIQMGLIPSKLPRSKNLHMEARFIPFDKVGGDFYYVKEDDEGVWLFMTDVSGHGMPAALIAAICHSSLLRYIEDSKLTPGKILTLMNDNLIPRLAGFYFTAFLAYYKKKSKKIILSVAGHPFPVIVTQNGRFRLLESGDPILGIFPGVKVMEKVLSLGAGDRLFVFTDGLYECRSQDNQMLGEDAIVSFLSSSKHLPLDVLSDKLIEYVKDFIGKRVFDDDLTFLALECL